MGPRGWRSGGFRAVSSGLLSLSYTKNMRQPHTQLGVLLLVLLAAAVPVAAGTLDPQPGFEEFKPDAAVRPDGEALLTWTRQQEAGDPWTAMAATLDPNSGQLGEIHEWGPGGTEEAVALGSGYLAVRLNVDPNLEWLVQHLDDSGRPAGEALSLGSGYIVKVSALPTPDGGALVIAAGVGGTGGPVQAWRFDSDGDLLSGPTVLADNSNDAAAGVDAAGNVVLAWNPTRPPHSPQAPLSARRFSPTLQPLGPVLEVSPSGGGGIRVAVAPDGRFVVVFIRSYRLQFRAYRADGSPLGEKRAFSVRSELVTPDDLDLAVGEDGRILVAWKCYENLNIPVIRARGLSFDGRAVTKLSRLALVKLGRGELFRPSVEALPGGDFLVLWSRLQADGETITLESRRVSGR
jgi:hypothetical protein